MKLHIRAILGVFFEQNDTPTKHVSDGFLILKLQKPCLTWTNRSFGLIQKFKILVKH